jgi:hypothetical protein
MQVSSLSLATAILQCNVTTNPSVVNSRDTVLSWFIANDGLRSETLTVPDPVKQALGILYSYIGNPTEFRDVPVLHHEEFGGNESA